MFWFQLLSIGLLAGGAIGAPSLTYTNDLHSWAELGPIHEECMEGYSKVCWGEHGQRCVCQQDRPERNWAAAANMMNGLNMMPLSDIRSFAVKQGESAKSAINLLFEGCPEGCMRFAPEWIGGTCVRPSSKGFSGKCSPVLAHSHYPGLGE